MTDIVKRLRETAQCADYIADRETAEEAADEIERLRKEIKRLRSELADEDDGQPDEAQEWSDYDPDC